MITLGQVLGKFITSNPQVMVVVTENIKAGSLLPVKESKIATTGENKTPVLVLTI